MKSYFQSIQAFRERGGSIKTTTITPDQLLPAIVSHIQRLDKTFTLYVNGRLPKSMDQLLQDAFAQSHLQQPFYTQHCEHRSYRYIQMTKNRIKIDFTMRYRMTRQQEKWMLDEIEHVLAAITTPQMTNFQKVLAVHDYIVRTYHYELQTEGSPYAVYTFMKEGHGVCMAYALLFEKMMELLHIPCYYVVGHADGESSAGHAWNMVELDGDWYHIDVTWDDIGSTSSKHAIRYRYFLVSDDAIKKNHQWDLAQYPPCTSNRYDTLHTLYDVAISNGQLYYPHPKHATLYTMDSSKPVLQAKKLDEARVQYCTTQDGILYFSNYSDNGYLYQIDLATGEVALIQATKVEKITTNLDGILIHFAGDDTRCIEKMKVAVETIDNNMPTYSIDVAKYTSIPFIHFDNTWFSSFEGSEQSVQFHCETGVALFIDAIPPQLTVNIELNKGVHIELTSKRKQVKLLQPAILKLPVQLVGQKLQKRHTSGILEDINVQTDKNHIIVAIDESTSFVID